VSTAIVREPLDVQANNTGRFMSPDSSGLAFADPTNPQSLNLYGYGLNNPLTNVDPSGLSCVTGDDGTQGDDGDGEGCAAAGILPSDQSAKDPNGNSTQFDPNKTQNVNVNPPAQGTDLLYDSQVAADQQHLTLQQPQAAPTSGQYLQAIGEAIAPIPNVCAFGVTGRVGAGRVQVGGDLNTQKGARFAAGIRGAQIGQAQLGFSIKGGSLSGTGSFTIPDTPISIGASTKTGTLTAVNVGARLAGIFNLQGYADIGTFGDPNCR
jgi:hypothetical protein